MSTMRTTAGTQGKATPPSAAERGPYVNVLGRAVAVLDALHGVGEPVTRAELSRRLGMSRTTVYRILVTLERHGLVERLGERYGLGLHLFTLGSAVQERLALARLARPFLTNLAETFRVSSYLSVRYGDLALCVDRVDRGGVQLSAYQAGEMLPLHVGAGPMVLLAGLPDDEVDRLLQEPLARPTPLAIADPAAIRTRVVDVRRSGIVYADSDLELGVVAIGTPVRGPGGRVVAALSVAGITQQITPERRESLIAALRNTALAISRQLSPSDPPQ
jgi:DNA-binding IclR family transcriptional regulator